jgi:CHAT domain-containing protein/tetratricopeptide (TPR) repeat protein
MKFLLVFFSTIFLFVALAQNNSVKDKNFINKYKKAQLIIVAVDKLAISNNYDEEKEQNLYKNALSIFEQILPEVEAAKDDSLKFNCYHKLGIIYHYFDSIMLAKKFYIRAIEIKEKNATIVDSAIFQPYVYLARIYYSQNKFDSSIYFYKKAEKITEEYNHTLPEEYRMFNGMGSIFFETGDFKQAKNYFEKALTQLQPNVPFYNDFLVNYKINIASALGQLNRYDDAKSIYESILKYNINKDDILLRLGRVEVILGNPINAIAYLKQINTQLINKVIFDNQMGRAYWLLHKDSLASKYYNNALHNNEAIKTTGKNVQHGLTYFYIAEKNTKDKNYLKSLLHFQQAIIQFYPSFNDTSIQVNPTVYKGVFSYLNLFNALIGKANVNELLFGTTKNVTYLNASLSAYKSAYKLASYVEKTYNSDDARLFLNKIKYSTHNKPIEVCLQLLNITKNKKYIDTLFLFDQQNKASVLTLNAKEQILKTNSNIDKMLLKKEDSCKALITLLSLKAANINDVKTNTTLDSIIRNTEISLEQIQYKIKDLAGFKYQENSNTIPSINQIQNILLNNTTLISYHLSENKIITITINKKDYKCFTQKIDSAFYSSIAILKNSISNFTPGNKFNNNSILQYFYELLIKNITNEITNYKTLIIIPHDELYNIPFEVLQNKNEAYLVEKYAICYQPSVVLLVNKTKEIINNNSVLAFAPFNKYNYEKFSALQYSEQEIANIIGETFTDTAATKNNFLKKIGVHSILHLATHTIVDDSNSSSSAIVFYPTPNDNKLYLQEIYNLKLNKTKLVILSACQTGTGKLTKGEGLVSLSRAFMYAGCPNILSSLWKTDDKSTSWLIQRFYKYLNKGFSNEEALQKAKIDYLKSNEIEKRFKSPNYWAHLVLTGLPNTRNNTNYTYFFIAFCIICFIILLYFKRKKILT